MTSQEVGKNKSSAVRPARASDAAGIAACLEEAFASYRDQYTTGAYRDTVPDEAGIRARMKDMTILVATTGEGGVVGTVAYAREPEGDGHLRGMAVVPGHRGTGLAAKLLMRAEQGLRGLGCRRCTLDTTRPLERAVRFYERHGYRRSGRTGDFFGMELFEYVKIFS